MIIYQVTQDLRLQDNLTLNTAILKAAELNQPLIAVWFPSASFLRAGKLRREYIINELQIFKKSLKARGIYFYIFLEPILNCINQLLTQQIVMVIKTQEWGVEEQKIDLQVAQKLPLICIEQGQLFNEMDLPFEIENTPEVFTQFRKMVENKTPIAKPLDMLLSPVTSLEVSAWQPLLMNGQEALTPNYWSGGEEKAWQHLKSYVWDKQAILTYKETRNGLVDFDDSTKISPFLSLGTLSPRQVFYEIKKFETQVQANESTYWVYFELLWREYFRWIAKKWGSRFYKGMKHSDASATHLGLYQRSAFTKWSEGHTEDDFINANMRELKITGWMSNRGRQNVASYFIHQLKLPWQIGASYFEQQLIDYDPFSNWGNWSYLAGVGQDPRSRVFNIQKQAQQYDPQGLYQKKWLSTTKD